MKCSSRSIGGAVLLAISPTLATAQAEERRLTRSEIEALPALGAGVGTSGVGGIRTTILSGDPQAAGPYTIEIRVPPNTRIASHYHRDERTAVVISGTWYFGYGAVAEDAVSKALTAGSFYTEPAGASHFASTRSEGAVVYISGFGPSDTIYIKSASGPIPGKQR